MKPISEFSPEGTERLQAAAENGERENIQAQIAQTLRVVILDDEKFDRMKLERLVASAAPGTSVLACPTLLAFSDAIKEQQFDLALVDRLLGEQSGNAAVALARRTDLNRHLPIIMVAGDAPPDEVVAAMDCGFTDYIWKQNLDADRLRAAFRKAFLWSMQEVGSEERRAAVMEFLLHEVADGYADEIRPHLRNIYNQLASLRRGIDPAAADLLPRIDAIETDCMRIWQFIDELGGHCRHYARRMM